MKCIKCGELQPKDIAIQKVKSKGKLYTYERCRACKYAGDSLKSTTVRATEDKKAYLKGYYQEKKREIYKKLRSNPEAMQKIRDYSKAYYRRKKGGSVNNKESKQNDG
jgi:hypothetical protein